jgi:hypothetical protein
MKLSGPLLTLALTAGVIFTLSPVSASTKDTNEGRPPLALLSLAEGDVRYSPNNESLKPSKPWEQAEEGMGIGQHGVLVTENGRAEVDLQNGAKVLLAENSVLVFQQLDVRDQAFHADLILANGTATIFGRDLQSGSLVFETPFLGMRPSGEVFARVDSYEDATAVTPQPFAGQEIAPTSKMLYVNAIGYRYLDVPKPSDPSSPLSAGASWDLWANWQMQHTWPTGPLCLTLQDILSNPACSCPSLSLCPDDPYAYLNLRTRKMHKHYTWVRVGKKIGFVPTDPKDRKGQPPTKLKDGLFIPSKELGKSPERISVDPSEKVTVLSKPPREFRGRLSPDFVRVAPPHIYARNFDESLPRGLSADASHPNGGGNSSAVGRSILVGSNGRGNSSRGSGPSGSSGGRSAGGSSGGAHSSGGYSGGGHVGGGYAGGGYSGGYSGPSGGAAPSGGGGSHGPR